MEEMGEDVLVGVGHMSLEAAVSSIMKCAQADQLGCRTLR